MFFFVALSENSEFSVSNDYDFLVYSVILHINTHITRYLEI